MYLIQTKVVDDPDRDQRINPYTFCIVYSLDQDEEQEISAYYLYKGEERHDYLTLSEFDVILEEV